MKHLKTVLAVSAALAGIGSAQAATYNYYVDTEATLSGPVVGLVGSASSTDSTPGLDAGPAAPGSFPLIGTATYDDVAGTLVIDFSFANYVHTPIGSRGNYTIVSRLDYTGTVGAGTFTTTAGFQTNISCMDGTIVCPTVNLKLGVPQALSATPVSGLGGGLLEQAFNVAGGTNTWTTKSVGGFVTSAYTMDFTPAAPVPVPAAAWLFGSGLLGLAGAARRRRSAA